MISLKINEPLYYFSNKYPQYDIEELIVSDIVYNVHEKDNEKDIYEFCTFTDINTTLNKKLDYERYYQIMGCGDVSEENEIFYFDSDAKYIACTDKEKLKHLQKESLKWTLKRTEEDLKICQDKMKELEGEL